MLNKTLSPNTTRAIGLVALRAKFCAGNLRFRRATAAFYRIVNCEPSK